MSISNAALMSPYLRLVWSHPWWFPVVDKRALALYLCHPLLVSNNHLLGIRRMQEHQTGFLTVICTQGVKEFTSVGLPKDKMESTCFESHFIWMFLLLSDMTDGLKPWHVKAITANTEWNNNVKYAKSYHQAKKWHSRVVCACSGVYQSKEISDGSIWQKRSGGMKAVLTCRAMIWGWCCSSGQISQQPLLLRSPKNGTDVNLSIPPWPFRWISCSASGCHLIPQLVKYLNRGRRLLKVQGWFLTPVFSERKIRP